MESSRLGAREAITLVAGRNFCLSDRDGSIRPGTSQGLYVGDVRVLNHLELLADGQPIELLAAARPSPERCDLVSRGPLGPGEVQSDLMVIRRRVMLECLEETIEVRNYAAHRLHCLLEMVVGADFADLFAVKGGLPAEHGRRSHAVSDHEVELAWNEGDAFRRIRLVAPEADRPGVDPLRHRWHLELAPGSTTLLTWGATVEVGQPQPRRVRAARTFESRNDGIPVMATDRSSADRAGDRPRAEVFSDPGGLQRIVARGTADLDALRLSDPALPRPVIAAGAPWFMTLFGRDALLSAWMALPLDTELAFGVLDALALLQGESIDARTEEEPGRILHEVRFHLAGATTLLEGDPYFGTIDAPPLFVWLLGELHRWGVALDQLAHLLPHADRALAWMEDFGDLDGDGLVEYERRNPKGLVNQGWKDSHDGIRFRDGQIPEAPIALCEVQGYAYAAYRARAELARHAGDEPLALRWERRASDLQARFEEAFWLEDEGRYAMALDRDKRPVDGLSSNPGHCLWSGIARPDRAARTAADMVGSELWSGWGVRTLGTANGGYNPMSYHCGSVWPHDTALVAAGLRSYGFDDEASLVIEGLVRAARANGGRLPELFCGLSTSELTQPVPFPTSCQPQAWAAASPWLLVRTLLGLQPDVPNGVVHVSPRLPEGLRCLRVDNVTIGDADVNFVVRGDSVEVEGLPPGLALADRRSLPV